MFQYFIWGFVAAHIFWLLVGYDVPKDDDVLRRVTFVLFNSVLCVSHLVLSDNFSARIRCDKNSSRAGLHDSCN